MFPEPLVVFSEGVVVFSEPLVVFSEGMVVFSGHWLCFQSLCASQNKVMVHMIPNTADWVFIIFCSDLGLWLCFLITWSCF